MIHNKFRYILTLVALFALTAGAWAQATFDVKEITADMVPADWNGDNTIVSPEDLATLGITFFEVTKAQASAWADYPKEGTVRLLYAYSTGFSSVDWDEGTPDGDSWNFTRKQIYKANATGYRYFVTVPTAAPSGPEVTWNKTTKQATFAMPAGDVELQVEYYPGMLTLGNAIEGGKLEVVGMGLGTTSFTAPSGWNQNSTKLASSHFEGFKGVTEEEAKAWPGVPATGMVALFYNYDETAQKWDMIYFKDGAFHAIYKGEPQQLATICNLLDANFSVFYTTGMQMPAGFEKDEEGNIYVADKTEFKVKATPAEGYRLVSLMFGETDVTDKVDADGIATVTMPEGENDITLTATFSDEYDLAFQAANANTIESGKATVKVGDTAATVTEGKLQGVKYGQTVTLTAKQGYKFRKVEAKKGAAPAAPAKPEYADNAEELPANTKLYMRADLVYNSDWIWIPTYTAEQAQAVANYYAAITGTKCAVIYGHGAETDIYYVTSDNGVSGTVYRSNNLTDKFPGYKVYLLK